MLFKGRANQICGHDVASLDLVNKCQSQRVQRGTSDFKLEILNA